ncbi:hypothetical protein [Arthrobacter castelli]|uniref:hypothetical protein n=1 Tax=Arthrobacter castelli TaxID=271431 RepID=UPI0004007276|nr:hypothetical protein [Arthrobacter castelli]
MGGASTLTDLRSSRPGAGDIRAIDELAGRDASIAEFPTTLEAARHASARGIATVSGAPNVLLGGSHSGNVYALELAREGVLNILASDYLPSSMLAAAFEIAPPGACLPHWSHRDGHR